ncbi:polysaccharide deacetylase family protein [Amphibacillus xylanus]|uniref:Putative hydrolase n=1 Tax=Amphibacillus xylanus (strain ATCC 51415 / DSM 6626 / JCM 7361 / LMG 17667 / NBRC 15112 / Ep01) TaxID=698758 RepID=K0J7P9_AMPXN|nr:polysaccharide deacetylase family protein [Amphibacillus xylanus]BAM47748.1 putative hydrolase [Amphibacillus xylanus NBRC 15112]
MKYGKMMFIVSLLFILFLVGCNEKQTIKDDEVIDEPEVEVETDESDNEDSTDDLDESEVDDVTQDDSLENLDDDDSEVEVMYQINQANWAVEPITDEADSNVVLLTIDDAPDKYALEMAKTLKELEVPAIFFVNGHFIQTEEKHEILKEIYQMGFSIGNHTYTHPNLGQISEEEQKQEIIELNDLIEEIIGERPKFFRAPFGVNTDNTKQVVEQEGMVLMNWTYGYDWESAYMEADALADIMVNTEYLRDGANLLMHDREWTSGALADIVTGLRDKGYDFVDPNQIQRPSK